MSQPQVMQPNKEGQPYRALPYFNTKRNYDKLVKLSMTNKANQANLLDLNPRKIS